MLARSRPHCSCDLSCYRRPHCSRLPHSSLLASPSFAPLSSNGNTDHYAVSLVRSEKTSLPRDRRTSSTPPPLSSSSPSNPLVVNVRCSHCRRHPRVELLLHHSLPLLSVNPSRPSAVHHPSSVVLHLTGAFVKDRNIASEVGQIRMRLWIQIRSTTLLSIVRFASKLAPKVSHSVLH